MYRLPSTSTRKQPSACLMKTGVPPTPLNARTGEETPPGISFTALANAAAELAVRRSTLGMVYAWNVSRRGARKKTAVRGRASRTAVGGESENREAKASYRFLYYPVGKSQSENLENVADLNLIEPLDGITADTY